MTTYVPGIVEVRLQDAPSVTLAVMAMEEVGQLTVRPVLGLTVEAIVMPPAKLKVLVRLSDNAVPMDPELKLTGVPPDTEKSPTWTTELLV